VIYTEYSNASVYSKSLYFALLYNSPVILIVRQTAGFRGSSLYFFKISCNINPLSFGRFPNKSRPFAFVSKFCKPLSTLRAYAFLVSNYPCFDRPKTKQNKKKSLILLLATCPSCEGLPRYSHVTPPSLPSLFLHLR
jgi:hypothetical protein